MEERDRQWQGSPLDLSESGMDPYGVAEIVIEFGDEESEVLRPRIREQFQSYELEQAAHYLEALSGQIRARRIG